MRNWLNFHCSTQKSEKVYIDGLFLPKGYNVKISLKGNAKIKGKLTCGLKSDIRNLVNLHFDWILLSKAYKDLDEKVQKSCLMTLKSDAKFEEKLTLGSKNDMRNLVSFNASSSKSKTLHLDVLLLSIAYKVSA